MPVKFSTGTITTSSEFAVIEQKASNLQASKQCTCKSLIGQSFYTKTDKDKPFVGDYVYSPCF